MNIIVKPKGSDLCYCRPDTTWERENKDFYVPDSVSVLYWTPVLFARVSKAGKCINPKFVTRYYDAFNFGFLMYTGEGEIAFTSCSDHTSILPAPLPASEMDGEYKVSLGGEEIFSAVADASLLEDALCKASQMTSVRIGDYVAVELDAIKPLASRPDGDAEIRATFSDKSLYGFKLIF